MYKANTSTIHLIAFSVILYFCFVFSSIVFLLNVLPTISYKGKWKCKEKKKHREKNIYIQSIQTVEFAFWLKKYSFVFRIKMEHLIWRIALLKRIFTWSYSHHWKLSKLIHCNSPYSHIKCDSLACALDIIFSLLSRFCVNVRCNLQLLRASLIKSHTLFYLRTYAIER